MAILVNAHCTVLQPPPLDFAHRPIGHRDASNPALGEHLSGLMGYVMKDGREMSTMRYAVLQHVQRVQHQYSFEIEEAELAAMGIWAMQANAILYFPNGNLVDPNGATLVDATDGSASDTAEVPYPADARSRKIHHEAWLEREQIPFAATLPPVIGEAEVLLREPDTVALRMMALTLVAIRAESLTAGEPIAPSEMQERYPSVFEALTPNERAFMGSDPAPDEQTVVDYGWRYEAADTLRWAMGRYESQSFPSEICDVPATAGDLVQTGPEAILASAALRPTSQILDHVDLQLRLHWASTDARIHQRPAPRGIQSSVLQERRHALNWLLRFENAEWDDVTTPT